MPDPDWDDLRFLLVLARAGRAAAAADVLRCDETTVARRLTRLERTCGVRLLDRSRGGWRPTEAGAALVAAAEEAERAVRAGVEVATGRAQAVAGAVRVSTVPILARRLLMPALPGLLAAHPALEITISAERRNVGVIAREADLALRLGRPDGEAAALARRVGTLDYGIYGTAHAPWLRHDAALAGLPHSRWLARQAGPRGALLIDDAELAIAALRNGAWRAVLPVALTPPDLGRLDGSPSPRELWLVSHPDGRDLPRIGVMADWIAGLCRAL